MRKKSLPMFAAALGALAAGCVQSGQGACKCRATTEGVEDGSVNDGDTNSPTCKPPEAEGGVGFPDRLIIDTPKDQAACADASLSRDPASLFSDAGYVFDAPAGPGRDDAEPEAGYQPLSDASTFGDGSIGPSEAGAPAKPAPSQPGDLIITEIMADPASVTDNQGEWFELYNPSPDKSYNLRGCEIADDNGAECAVDSDFILPPLGFATVARSDQPGFSPSHVCSGLSLTNSTPDQVIVRCKGVLIDRVAYEKAKAGAGLSLDPAALDARANDEPSAWCWATQSYNGEDLGTPGAPNPTCVQ